MTKRNLAFVAVVLVGVLSFSNEASSFDWSSVKKIFNGSIFKKNNAVSRPVELSAQTSAEINASKLSKNAYDALKKSGYCFDSDGGNFTATKGEIFYFIANDKTGDLKMVRSEDRCKSEQGLFLYEFDCAKYEHGKISTESQMYSIVSCPADEICVKGACVPPPCNDSDMGVNFTAKGSVMTFANGVKAFHQDKCKSDTELTEGFCAVDKSYSATSINCCDFGMVCSDGACVYPTIQPSACSVAVDVCPQVDGIQTEFLIDQNNDGVKDACVPVTPTVCTDPDPAVVYPNATIYNHEGGLHLGFCIAATGKVLHIICDPSNQWQADITDCQSGLPCFNGSCVSCVDTDSGVDTQNYGSVYGFDASGVWYAKNDGCWLNKTFQVEWSCEANKPKQTEIECPPNTVCEEQVVNGLTSIACVPFNAEPTCVDSDGGNDPAVYGAVSGVGLDGSTYLYSDSCVGSSMIEYYCKDNLKKVALINCTDGKFCQQAMNGSVTTFTCIDQSSLTSCADSDAGVDYEHFGEVSGIKQDGTQYSYADACLNDGGGMLERSCDGAQYDTDVLNCTDGKVCKDYLFDGIRHIACVANCFKAGDPTDDVYKAGTVFDIHNNSYPDFCVGNELRQYSCVGSNGEKIDLPAISCPNGCANGACK